MRDDILKLQQLKKHLILQLQLFEIEHSAFPACNLNVSIPAIPMLPLLKGQSILDEKKDLLPFIYWQDKEQHKTVASFGAIEQLHCIPTVGDEAIYLGGLAFQQHGEQWADFPPVLFIRPAMMFEMQGDHWQVIFQFNGQYAIQQSINLVEALQPPKQLANTLPAQPLIRQDSPNKKQWANLIELAIEYKALLPKVVLSRETTLSFEEVLNAWDIMSLWQQANPHSFHYVLQLSATQQFISCSPERLYARDGKKLTTEALAGTLKRSDDQHEDNLLQQSLLNNKKIDRENYLVQESIIAHLKKLKAHVTCESPQVMQLKNVQHLCVPIKAELPPQTQDADLLFKLHPTPAVGGSPKLPALQFIQDNEPYDRGWYAGAVGYLSEQKSDFSVAIRSALLDQKSIKLFAGAGIVTGSIAEQEWQELENKIQTILAILNVQ